MGWVRVRVRAKAKVRVRAPKSRGVGYVCRIAERAWQAGRLREEMREHRIGST